MGYAIAYSPCIRCRQPFRYNPLRVPSVRYQGQREPICRDCIAIVNPIRIARGLDPIVALPGAYDPIDERLLDED
jgi:hypothetical protein